MMMIIHISYSFNHYSFRICCKIYSKYTYTYTYFIVVLNILMCVWFAVTSLLFADFPCSLLLLLVIIIISFTNGTKRKLCTRCVYQWFVHWTVLNSPLFPVSPSLLFQAIPSSIDTCVCLFFSSNFVRGVYVIMTKQMNSISFQFILFSFLLLFFFFDSKRQQWQWCLSAWSVEDDDDDDEKEENQNKYLFDSLLFARAHTHACMYARTHDSFVILFLIFVHSLTHTHTRTVHLLSSLALNVLKCVLRTVIFFLLSIAQLALCLISWSFLKLLFFPLKFPSKSK